MNEQHFVEVTAQVLSDTTPLDVTISIQQAWVMVSAIQLATRHPHLSTSMKRLLTETARQFQAAIAHTHPEASELLEMGWNPDFDVDVDESEDS